MTAVLIDPHGDDAALFAAFLCIRHRPLVIVTHRSVPVYEIDRAMYELGCVWTQRSLAEVAELDARVITPAWEKDGLPEHNEVADAVGADIRYLTYAGYPRQKSRGREVEFEPEWLWRKLRALAAFESQASTPSWERFREDMREYVA